MAQNNRIFPGSPNMESVRRNSIVDKFEITRYPLPEVPDRGARIKVLYAGASYGETEVDKSGHRQPRTSGIDDTSLFPGFEVSGVIDEVGPSATPQNTKLTNGSRVIVFPAENERTNVGFPEYITVNDINDLVSVPTSVPMEVAAILPTGALRSYSAVLRARPFIEEKLSKVSASNINVLIVGAGAMGIWTQKMARQFLSPNVKTIVADKNARKLEMAKDEGCYGVVHWSDKIHEEHILERTRDVCRGGVDVAIDFVSSVRSIGRITKVLNKEGVVIVGGNSQQSVTFDLTEMARMNQSVCGVDRGTVEQLESLVQLFAAGKLTPVKYTIFPVEAVNEVFDLLSSSQIEGRAVLKVSKSKVDPPLPQQPQQLLQQAVTVAE